MKFFFSFEVLERHLEGETTQKMQKKLTADVQGPGESLDTVELVRLSIVDRVRGNEEGEESLMGSPDPLKGDLGEPGPGAVDDGRPVVLEDVPVQGRHHDTAHGSQDEAFEPGGPDPQVLDES